MKANCNDYLKKAKVRKFNSPDLFDLDRYIEKDHSRAKEHAHVFGRLKSGLEIQMEKLEKLKEQK